MKVVYRFLQIFGLLLITIGALLTYQRFNPAILSFAHFEAPTQRSHPSAILPTQIDIPSEHLSLPIYPARIYNDNWQTTTLGVSYLVDSPLPGDRGNSILYGHNWQALLGNLVYVKPGGKITITYADKSVKEFIIQYTTIVSPTDVSILHQSVDRRITIYTCTGFLDGKRFVVVATASTV